LALLPLPLGPPPVLVLVLEEESGMMYDSWSSPIASRNRSASESALLCRTFEVALVLVLVFMFVLVFVFVFECEFDRVFAEFAELGPANAPSKWGRYFGVPIVFVERIPSINEIPEHLCLSSG
jgi:hypothetical protein